MKKQIVLAVVGWPLWQVIRLALLAGVGFALLLAAVVVAQLAWFALLLIPLFVLYLVRSLFAPRRPSGAFGTAVWARRRTLERTGMLDGGGLVLGRPWPEKPRLVRAVKDLVIATPDRSEEVSRQMLAAFLGAGWGARQPLIRLNRFNHLLTVSPAGGGKGVSLVLTNLLTWGEGSVVVIDPKGENYTLSSVARRRMGQEVYRVDPFGVCGPGGAKFNPLDLIKPASPFALTDCLALAEALVVRSGHETDPYWSNSAVTCLQAFIFFVICHGKPGERNLLTVRELIADEDCYAGTLQVMRQSELAGGALRRLGNQLSRLRDKELASVLSSTLSHLAFLDNPPVSASLSSSDFDPADLVRKKMSVYLILPPAELTSQARLMRLWLSSFVRRLAQGSLQEKNLVLFLLDEVGNLGPMPVLKDALTVLRGYGVRLWFFLQSLAQLTALFPDGKGFQTAHACIDTQVYFGLRDRETAEEVSAYIGDKTTYSYSETETTGTSRPTLWAILSGGSGASEQKSDGTSKTGTEIGRRLIQAAEILQLPERAALVLTRGVPPLSARLVRYYEDEEFEGLAVPAAAEGRGREVGVRAGPPALPRAETAVRVRCGHCKQLHRVQPDLLGRVGTCKACGRQFLIGEHRYPAVG